MKDMMLHIPFQLNGKTGTMEVLCEENKSTAKSGFDLLNGPGFDAEMAIGYPTMHSYIKYYEGTGYYTASGWIQIITDKFYSSLDDIVPTQVVTAVDASEIIIRSGVPFFSYGFLPEIYDAPCNNLGDYKRLQWIADTFFVTFPSRINEDTISYILGFRWGYEEWDEDGVRRVKISPLEVTQESVWEEHLILLRENFKLWKFK